MQIPKALQSRQEELLATKVPYVHIEPFETDEVLEPWASKYRGIPYLPKGTPYPQGTSGRPLALLAQINFSEVPKLEHYPTSGILQFFIWDNDLMGLEFTEPYNESDQFQLQQQQNNFRVIYYPEVFQDLDLLETSFEFLPQFEFLPVDRPCRLDFSLREELIHSDDYRFEQIFGNNFPDYSNLSEEERMEHLLYDVAHQVSKIGGYASFTQVDIRTLAPPDENWLLLLQIAGSDQGDIMWGDAGVGNFFIEEKALQTLDFSKVLYNWDCG
ncbi:DUF1963 domain-containing protein [Microcoleus sp. FACHB-1515]|uniref:YwqG family protein n=1 Tax=Cyanophyceae TaxID=3028117 RepID=UPI0016859648|nr:DUF1963 domain-containing protein [Microcoleus sp. FACHB-1515]MBD2092687.1 DUF1963 domain-containing protein [Microcoleus sp. FACHB-1515]